MPRFSANLGFLWTELPLSDAVRAAKTAGFDAVELHWPYETPAQDVKAALDETGLAVLGLNTRRGNVPKGENGLFASLGREEEAFGATEHSLKWMKPFAKSAFEASQGRPQGDAHNDQKCEGHCDIDCTLTVMRQVETANFRAKREPR